MTILLTAYIVLAFRMASSIPLEHSGQLLIDEKQENVEESRSLSLMIVGGWEQSWNSKYSKVEIVNPSKSSINCTKIDDIPFNRVGGIAELFDNVPIICGGRTEGDGRYESRNNACWALKNNKWEDASQLQHTRSSSASIILPDNTLWITGGGKITGNTSEILRSLDSNFEPGPQLPEIMADHCMAKINTTHIAIIGGGNSPGDEGHDTKMAYLVNVESKPFTFFKLPPLIRGRSASACGVISMKQPNGNERKVLLAAGGYGGNSKTTTEFYDLENAGVWQEGPKLPHSWCCGGHIVHQDTIYILGGHPPMMRYNDIMVFNQTTNKFDVLPTKLSVSRYSFGVISVDQQKYCNSH